MRGPRGRHQRRDEEDDDRLLPAGPWGLHFHDPGERSYEASAYRLVALVCTVADWARCDRAFAQLLPAGMFFLMADGVDPTYESGRNVGGGCFSFKVHAREAARAWFDMGALVLGGTAGPPDAVTGMSIAPKRGETCLMRLWVAKGAPRSPDTYHLPCPRYARVAFKAHDDRS